MHVKMQTNYGTLTIALEAEKAPKTVENFLSYVNSGFYDGTIFHRVIKGFVIQGGGYEPKMHEKPTNKSIKNEADNGLKNKTGTLAMARTPDPHSATSQFFVNLNNNDFLDYTASSAQGWGYCVFGKIATGMEVIHKIEAVATTSRTGHQDVPVNDVIIEKMEVIDE